MSYLVKDYIKPSQMLRLTRHIKWDYFDGVVTTKYVITKTTEPYVGTYCYTNYFQQRLDLGWANTFGAIIKFNDSDFVITEPLEAQEEMGEVRIKLTIDAKTDLKVVLFDHDEITAEDIYNQLYTSESAGTITTEQDSITLQLTNDTQYKNLKKYGVGIIPVVPIGLEDLPDHDASISRTNNVYISAQQQYQNRAAAGLVTLVSPSAHGILYTNYDNTLIFRYTQDFDIPMDYLGVKLTNLNTGTILQLYKLHLLTTSVDSGSTGSFIIPANTMTDGLYKIELSGMPSYSRGYYSDDNAIWISGSTFEYNVKTKAVAGNISCDGKPVPTISWISEGQAIYQVRFGDYDSGAKIGTETSYIVPRIFADGNYPVQVRTANTSGEWSEWTEIEYVYIENISVSGAVILSADIFENNVLLSWSSTVDAPDNYAVFRDGELIAVVTDTTYIDVYGNGNVEYQILAMKNKYYIASNATQLATKLQADVISYNGGVTYQVLKYTPSAKVQTEDINTAVTYSYYAGRRKPIAVSSEQKTRIKSFLYIFKKRAEATALLVHEGTSALLKTTRGAIIYGIIYEMTLTDSKYPIVSFSIREIDREGENVEYPV